MNVSEQETALAERDQQIEQWRRQAMELERQNADLIHLYSAVFMIYSELNTDGVVRALQQIVINQIGSESFSILELDHQGSLTPLVEMGPARIDWNGESPPATRARKGRQFISNISGTPEASMGREPLAVIPLLFEEKLTGVVVIFDLLPQKRSLNPLDRQLFDLMSFHGGTALAAARCFSESAG